MADEDDNVVPFQRPQRRRREADAPRGSTGEGGGSAGTAQRRPPPRASSGGGADEPSVPGKLVWLHCPTCGTLEYTEMTVTGGRTHNRCGTAVEEVELELDLRGEFTLAAVNLERLRALTRLIEAQKRRYEEYQQRLRLAARQNLSPYELTEERLQQLPVAEMDGLGMLVPDFLYRPERRFGLESPPQDEDDPGAAPDEGGSDPDDTPEP